MKLKQRCLLLLIWWTAATLGVQRATAVTFADGQTHVIDQPSGTVSVRNSDPPDSAPTTAIIDSGGSIELFASGGIGLNAFDSSIIELAGGSVITHGAQGHGVFATHDAKLRISSGTITVLGSGGNGVSLEARANAEIAGGSINASNATGYGLNATNQAIVTIYGGTIRGTQGALSIGGNAQVHVYGGLLGDMDGGIDLTVGGEAHFYGSQFFLDGQPVGPGLVAGPNAFEGRLTGVLLSGDPLDLGVKIFDLGGPSTPRAVYVHLVPEPAALLLGSVTMLWAVAQRRRRR